MTRNLPAWVQRTSTWSGPLLIALVSVLMLRWGWGKWTDLMIDFGRELYVPWRLVQGDSLYIDIAHFHGPFSPYFNALVFSALGTSLRSLVLVNLTIAGAVGAMLYATMARLAGRLAAVVGGVVFVTTFAFSHSTQIGNSNFVTPYSHEMTHGLALAMAALLFSWRYSGSGSQRSLAVSGLMLGLVFLTKPEFLIAALPAVVVSLAVSAWSERAAPSRLAREFLLLVAAAAVPILAAVGALAMRMPFETAVRGVLGSWPDIARSELHALPFYQGIMGTLDTGRSLRAVFLWVGRYCLVLIPAALAALYLRIPKRREWLFAGLTVAVLVGPVVLLRERLAWWGFASPFPLILVVGSLLLLARVVRQRREGDVDRRLVQALSFSVFALLLLAKMLLATLVHNYGFVLALPAMMVVVMLLVSAVPRWIDRRGGHGAVFQWVAVALLALVVGLYLQATATVYRSKTVRIGTGADAFLVDDRGRVAQRLLDRIERDTTSGQTLAVMPEGVMLNYLSRRRNPTPYLNFMPPELIVFGEQQILGAYMATPPDLLVLTNRGAVEYGFRALGQDYGQSIGRWLETRFAPLERFEDPSLANQEFSRLMLLGRRD